MVVIYKLKNFFKEPPLSDLRIIVHEIKQELEETTDLKDFFIILVVLFIRNMKV